jgi:hypothetical protein
MYFVEQGGRMKGRVFGTKSAGSFAEVRVLIVFMLVLIAACGGKETVKQPSQDSKISEEAFSIAEALRTAYVKKDFSSVADKCTKEAYKEFIDSIKFFDSVELVFTPRWVEIEKSKVYLNVAWRGSWFVGKDTARERGMAVLLFEGTPLKLSKIERGNPFRYPEAKP